MPVKARTEYGKEMNRQYMAKLLADQVRREKNRESHRRYIAKVMADPVKREKYLEKRKEYHRRHIAKLNSVGVPMTTKYYLISHVPDEPVQTTIQRFDDEVAIADHIRNQPGFAREQFISEVGHEPEWISGHDHVIIKGELIEWPPWPYKNEI